MMLISELSFPHLQAEREAQLTRELERRRVVLERIDEQPARPTRGRRHDHEVPSERMPRAERRATGTHSTEPCPV
jgi:hypothetical protein